MAFEPTFLALMPQEVLYQPFGSISTDGYGAPTWATTGQAKTVRARIQAIRADTRTASSREITGASFKLVMAPYSTAGTSDSVTVTPLDKITLPTGFLVAGSCSPPIIRAYPVQDETGHHHNEVWI